MKLAILGDTHFGMRNDSLALHALYRKFYTETFFPYLEEHGIDHVIQLGDLFDRRKYINFHTLALAREYFFDPLKAKGIVMTTILGNHDIYYKNTLDVNSTSMLLKEYDNIHVVKHPVEVDFGNGAKFDLIPWICEQNEDEIVKFIDKSKNPYCIGHFELSGFEMDRGNICWGGHDASFLENYELVISGHFHHKSKNGNILYAGTPGEITWADYGDERGFHTFDTKTHEMEFIKNPNRIFLKIKYDDENLYYDTVTKADYSKYANKYVKVIVARKENEFLFEQFIDKLSAVNPLDVQIIENFGEDFELLDEELDEAEDTVTIIDKVVDGLEMNLNKDKLKSLMREIYTEALATE